jgi:hypothetical protein
MKRGHKEKFVSCLPKWLSGGEVYPSLQPSAPRYLIGSRVLVTFDDGIDYAGTITNVTKGGTDGFMARTSDAQYSIAFEDGDHLDDVTEAEMKFAPETEAGVEEPEAKVGAVALAGVTGSSAMTSRPSFTSNGGLPHEPVHSSTSSSASHAPDAARDETGGSSLATCSLIRGWTCPRCTLLNATSAARCVVCSKVRPSSSRAPAPNMAAPTAV